MAGETALDVLLRDLAPSLAPDTFVFCTLPGGRYGDLAHTQPLASVAEAEGLTLVLTQARADAEGLAYEGLFRCVTLSVHSSLEAVGLTAAVAGLLTRHGVSANVIAGYHHDHVLVPAERADEVVGLLRSLADETTT